MSPMQLLLLISPLAANQGVIYASLTEEVVELRKDIGAGFIASSSMLSAGLVLNALVALALNIVSLPMLRLVQSQCLFVEISSKH